MRVRAIGLCSLGLLVLALLTACTDAASEEGSEAPSATPAAAAQEEPVDEAPDAAEPEEPTTPATAGRLTTFGDGTYRVGLDLAPGRYRTTTLGSGCSWQRLRAFGGGLEDIIAITLPQGASALVDIAPTDLGFETSGCGTWTSDLSPASSAPSAPFGDGTYLVGVDIAPGTWRAPGGGFCSWQRLAGFSGELDDIIAIELPDGATIVTIAESDAGFETAGCGVWQRI